MNFNTAKSPCASFSGSIIKCAVGLDVTRTNDVAAAFKKAEMLLFFWLRTGRLQGTTCPTYLWKFLSLFCGWCRFFFYAVEQGRKHIAERKEKVYNTSLAMMSTSFHSQSVYRAACNTLTLFSSTARHPHSHTRSLIYPFKSFDICISLTTAFVVSQYLNNVSHLLVFILYLYLRARSCSHWLMMWQ